MKNFFQGWYFKQQNAYATIAFIVGCCNDHAFVQVITDKQSYQYAFAAIKITNNKIYIGDSVFSTRGIKLSLPDFCGELSYGPLAPLRTDIMGPFRFFPMQCRHAVISMNHTTTGTLYQHNTPYTFKNGTGYIEADSGTSFPSAYFWLQCNAIRLPCSLMLSIANVPFYGLRFKGCICAIQYKDAEYRLATYNGVRILVAHPHHICLLQNDLLLELDILSWGKSFPLSSPKQGKMSGQIKESCNATIQVRLWKQNVCILHFQSNRASFENHHFL